MELDESLFFSDINSTDDISEFIDKLKEYSKTHSKQVYLLDKILGIDKQYQYEIKNVIYVLIPKHKVVVVGYGGVSNEELQEYRADFIDDVSHIIDKYNYDIKLGRPRKWSYLIEYSQIDNFTFESFIVDEQDNNERKVDLLISILTGSINDIDYIDINKPDDDLEAIKKKIILFDGKQSSFIYQKSDDKRITIQGMAGTGKTELLLHKLKEVYNTNDDCKIAFTCFNKVLADSMQSRIPNFFNFMKVSKQIVWNKNLFVMPSWGSRREPRSGIYSYICNMYNLDFYSYSQNRGFDDICKQALLEINSIKNFTPCFDYLFIDESQDFGNNFFDLCEKITKNTIYIAGDIFQNIFERSINTTISPHYLLNNCYRTDPKTLMFAHAIGLGLYEDPPIDWLSDDDWNSCGYSFNRDEDKNFILTRAPLRRFEDIKNTKTAEIIPINIFGCQEVIISRTEQIKHKFSQTVVSVINIIKNEFPTVLPNDIGIILTCDYKLTSQISTQIQVALYEEFKWESALGFETKRRENDKVYITNVNNVKGLEFPFVICLTPTKVRNSARDRNALYMAVTRSFLRSYFLVEEYLNADFISLYQNALQNLHEHGVMKVKEPEDNVKQAIKEKVRFTLKKAKKPIAEILYTAAEQEFRNKVSDKRINDVIEIFSDKLDILPVEELIQRVNNTIKTSL